MESYNQHGTIRHHFPIYEIELEVTLQNQEPTLATDATQSCWSARGKKGRERLEKLCRVTDTIPNTLSWLYISHFSRSVKNRSTGWTLVCPLSELSKCQILFFCVFDFPVDSKCANLMFQGIAFSGLQQQLGEKASTVTLPDTPFDFQSGLCLRCQCCSLTHRGASTRLELGKT